MKIIKVTSHGKTIKVAGGSNLADTLMSHGIAVRFSCGGNGVCGKCAVQIIEGQLPVTGGDERFFTPEQLEEGWRLACSAIVDSDITVDVQSAPTGEHVLSDHEDDFAHTTHTSVSLGLAVDIGTTTIAASLVDLSSAKTLASAGLANPQNRRGDDVISRIQYSSEGETQLKELQKLTADTIDELIEKNCEADSIDPQTITHITVGGNPAMQFLLAGIDCSAMAVSPFTPPRTESFSMRASDLGITKPSNDCDVQFLPVISGYVGGDIVADVLACGLHETQKNILLIDVGTNGEMILSAGGQLYATSTAAGPAFEGARISQGMRNISGAIKQVCIEDKKLVCKTVDDFESTGICGTGLIDAVACLLDLELIDETGAMDDESVNLTENVKLTQRDIREVQLAKAAIHAGAEILLKEAGVEVSDLDGLILAGAFGSYLDPESALRIGLLCSGIEVEKVSSAGNTALAGIRRCLINHDQFELTQQIAAKTKVIELGSNLNFQTAYADAMFF